MFKPNLITIIISCVLGLFVSIFAFLEPIMLLVYLLTFIALLLFRTSNFWLVILAYLVSIFIFLQQFSYKYGITTIEFGSSYVFVFMIISCLAILMYTCIGVFEWKKNR